MTIRYQLSQHGALALPQSAVLDQLVPPPVAQMYSAAMPGVGPWLLADGLWRSPTSPAPADTVPPAPPAPHPPPTVKPHEHKPSRENWPENK